MTFLLQQPFKLRAFFDVSRYFSTEGAGLATETWCHVTLNTLLIYR
jgi:hypothetical protein